jgi:hypothetical protein
MSGCSNSNTGSDRQDGGVAFLGLALLGLALLGFALLLSGGGGALLGFALLTKN